MKVLGYANAGSHRNSYVSQIVLSSRSGSGRESSGQGSGQGSARESGEGQDQGKGQGKGQGKSQGQTQVRRRSGRPSKYVRVSIMVRHSQARYSKALGMSARSDTLIREVRFNDKVRVRVRVTEG